MKQLLGVIATFFITVSTFGQINLKTYFDLSKVADSLYDEKQFKDAAIKQSTALALLDRKALFSDRYAVVNYWTLAKQLDRAFSELQQLSLSPDLSYKNIDLLLLDDELPILRADPRWKPTLNELYIAAHRKYLEKCGFKVNTIENLTDGEIDFALALANRADSAFEHVNDKAYSLLKQKEYDKAYKLFKFSIDFYSPNRILYKNMMDYYIATHDRDRAYVYFSKADVVKYKQTFFIADTSAKVDSILIADYKRLSQLLDSTVHPAEYLVRLIAVTYAEAGITEKASRFFKLNVDLHPSSYTANKDFGNFLYQSGKQSESIPYHRKAIVLEYQLPSGFFEEGFDIDKYILQRNLSFGGEMNIKTMSPEPFIDDVANQFARENRLKPAEQLFLKNVRNYPTSYYAYKSMSTFYQSIKNKIKQQEFDKKAEAAKEQYGTRKSRVFKNGPVADTTFDVSVKNPVCQSNCPIILVDYVHRVRTIASLENDFKALFKIFANDGFNIKNNYYYLTDDVLGNVDVLFLQGGQFDNDEIEVINNWVRRGGSLLTFTHHDWPLFDPVLESFGVETNGIAMTSDSLHGLVRDRFNVNPSYIYLSQKDSLLGNHTILRGRNGSEQITKVQTFSSKAIVGPPGSANLLKLSPSAIDFMYIDDWNNTSKVPVRSKNNSSLGVAFEYGKGKVVVTDSWALMALIFENSERGIMGMNTPGNDNKQFALNIMRWLTGYLK